MENAVHAVPTQCNNLAMDCFCSVNFEVPPPPLYELRPCPSYSRHRDCINLVILIRNFNSVPNLVQP